MTISPTLASRLAGGDSLLLAWCGIADPVIPESLVRAGFDVALVDMQHGAYDITTAAAAIAGVAGAGKQTLVRIPVGDFAVASRLLDAGAAGIVAPMINSVADAEALVSFCKFPPLGTRSWGPARVIALTGLDAPSYLQQANRIHLAVAMIETKEAIAALDGILAVPGIDGVLVGPSDLSIALSEGAAIDPHGEAVGAALRTVVDRARAHGKFAAAFCINGARAKALTEMGFQLCAVGTDGVLLNIGAAGELATARG